MARVLITNLPGPGMRFRTDHPMGLVYLGTALRDRGHEVSILDAQIDNEWPLSRIRAFAPDVLGVSLTTDMRFDAFRLCEEAKAENPHLRTVLGGPHCTNTCRDIVERVAAVDCVLKGYGERRFADLVEGVALAQIPGLVYRDAGVVCETAFDGAPEKDGFILPEYELLPLESYDLRVGRKRALPLFTSRGCCNRCAFCAAGFFSRRVAFAPLELVIENIDLIRSLGYDAVRIQDDTFGMRRDDAISIMEHLRRSNLAYSIKSRVALMDDEFLRLLGETGCYGIKFGVESVVPHVLEQMDKRLDLPALERCLETGVAAGLMMGGFFIIGNPGESYADALSTIDYCGVMQKRKAIPLATVGCYIFPGTALESLARQEGCLPEEFSWSHPFRDKRNQFLDYADNVPVYRSASLGFSELEALRGELRKRVFILDLANRF